MNRQSTWLVYDIPITGDRVTVLARQARMPVPGKLIRKSQLRIELPVPPDQSPESMRDQVIRTWRAPAEELDAAMETQLAHVEQAVARSGFPSTGSDAQIHWLLYPFEPADSSTELRSHAWLRGQRHVATIEALTPERQAVLIHYLIALNSVLRECRASLADGAVTVEAFVLLRNSSNNQPAALNALNEAAALLKTMLPWLQRPDVIARYHSFHRLTKGGDAHEHVCRSSRLVPLARSG
jgi:hypothetical protein